ncbi:protein-methionine-sulfoxide reductase heme-binding subunit MsrQ [Caulobacter segnis]|uniref:protein-methionine-sulfoxide reductase heme-binding subunit MsrQ n=1 Tax=Caulobacter segnis TaxID=88688 RepID=UPI001CC0E266|nr:protein-methionine-sulfoxide reductase heme-binding subunit MsrQ [Caulobacter segnis]UAL09534.1 protein-methionine-sulfoxide reductase heme-binding subunit MsrQ [Caulobacter segnis]
MASAQKGKSKRPSKLRDSLVYALVWLACFAPIVWLAWKGYAGELGANPIEKLIRQLGVWGLRLLLVGLAITPAARILKAPRLVRFRRTIGLFAFSYIVLHLVSYVGVDLFFDFRQLWKDILKRPFITLGMAGFLLLIPLAVTSTNGWVIRLGRAAWSRLHRLIYVIVPLGVVHYYLLVKADHRPPLIYGAVFVVLMGWRAWDAWASRPGSPAGTGRPARP